MGKRRLTDSEIRLLLVFLSAIMLVCAYFLSYQKNMDLSKEIEAQNEQDRAYVELLESMISRREAVEAQTAEYQQAIDEIVAKYPSELPTEKAIENIHMMENNTGVKVNNISFSMGNLVLSLDGSASAYVDEYIEEENEDGEYIDEEYSEEEYLEEEYLDDEYLEEEPVESAGSQAASAIILGTAGYRDVLSMSYEADYSTFKRMIAYIEGLSDRTTIPSITAAYDASTGNITGAVTINMYHLSNTDREYEIPVIPGSKGVTDIFRSGNGVTATVTEAASEESDEDNGDEQESEEENEG